MLTIFSTPKPFVGHINIIQRNAIQSWQRLHPDAEIILFGPEEGAAETAREFDIRHEPRVDRNEHGTKFLASFFNRAEDLARHPILCYVNCDIILTGDLVKAMRACPQPIVAAVNGVCAGAGAILAMASDIRLAAQDAKTAFLFNRVGLAGCDMGA